MVVLIRDIASFLQLTFVFNELNERNLINFTYCTTAIEFVLRERNKCEEHFISLEKGFTVSSLLKLETGLPMILTPLPSSLRSMRTSSTCMFFCFV